MQAFIILTKECAFRLIHANILLLFCCLVNLKTNGKSRWHSGGLVESLIMDYTLCIMNYAL